jgi:hypothetical protein
MSLSVRFDAQHLNLHSFQSCVEGLRYWASFSLYGFILVAVCFLCVHFQEGFHQAGYSY